MSNNANGKGNNNGPKSAAEQTEIRRAKKKLQRSRLGGGKDMHSATLFQSKQESDAILAENALAERLEKHLDTAIDLAHQSLRSMTTAVRAVTTMRDKVRKVVTKKVAGAIIVVTKPAFPEETVEGMNALLNLFFKDTPENSARSEAYPVSTRTANIVLAHFVFACEVFGLGDAFRKDIPGYNQVASGKTLRDQVSDYQRKLRAAELAAKSKQQVA